MKNMLKSVFILVFLFACQAKLFAQFTPELPLILDKPGTFEILSTADYTSSECRFTKTEITANLQSIFGLVNTVRKNPVLSDIKGFDGRVRIYNVDCTDPGGYGIPSRISFEFCSWYRQEDGTPARSTIEPPCWSIIVNKMIPDFNRIFAADAFYADPRYFTLPVKKETPERGIDVYIGECFIIYNPDRPDYWLPVTVNEVFSSLIAHFKKDPDKIAAAEVLKYVEKEYAEIPESERNSPAYVGGGPVAGISSKVSDTKYMQVNPEYWDKSLSKSAIQFLFFRWVPNKGYYTRLKEEYLQHNSISYNEYRFLESYGMDDIRLLVPLIGK